MVWDMTMQPTKKFVLLALADCANDVGTGCFPSVPTIAKKCSLSVRVVRKCIGELSHEGHITINERSGRSSTYDIHPGTSCTGERGAGVNVVPAPPAPDAGVPRHVVQGTPARGAPITVTEPPIEPSSNRQAAKRRVVKTDFDPKKIPGLNIEAWNRFVEYRRQRKPAIKPCSMAECAKELADFGNDQEAVVAQSIRKQWQGLFALHKPKQSQPIPEHSRRPPRFPGT